MVHSCLGDGRHFRYGSGQWRLYDSRVEAEEMWRQHTDCKLHTKLCQYHELRIVHSSSDNVGANSIKSYADIVKGQFEFAKRDL